MIDTLLIALTVLGGILALSGRHWMRLFEEEAAAAFRLYRDWAIKGLGVPLLVWTLFNSGIVPGVPSLSTDLELARAAGLNPVGPVLRIVAAAAVIVGGYWVAVTYGWMFTSLLRRLADRSDVVVLGVLVAMPAVPLGWMTLRFGGWWACGWAVALWLVPTVHLALPLDRKIQAPPSYARALAKLQFRKFAAAEQEVLQELDRCQDDYEGWMMLAGMYANHFGEVLEADLTVRELCEQPNLSGAQIALALHRLADWHLKLADDPARAREALQTIIHKLPDTHFARMAQQQIDQLPRNREELREQREHKPLRLPVLKDPLDESAAASAAPVDRAEAARQANQLAERLRQDPNEVAVREKLAVVLAEQLQKADLGIEQLELLLAMPDQPEAKTAHWLSLMAAWQIRYRQDWAAAGPLLERLVRDYPQSPQAFLAQRHLNLHQVELRLRPTPPAPQLSPTAGTAPGSPTP
jgi:hypothetical protein